MNVLRDYKPQVFDILGLTPGQYSKYKFGKHVEKFIQQNGWDRADMPNGDYMVFDGKPKGSQLNVVNRYYSLNNTTMRLLTNITDCDKYMLFENNELVNDSSKFYTIIYKRWVLRNLA